MATPLPLYQCRLCLNKTSSRVNVFGGDFPGMLEVLTSIKVHEDDGLPKYSCTKCAEEVQMALAVKKRIIEAHQFLLEALENKRAIFETIEITPIINIVESSVPKKRRITKQKIVSKKSKPIIKQNQTQPKSELVESSKEATTNKDANEVSVKCDIKTEVVEKTNQPNTNKEEKGALDQDIFNEVQSSVPKKTKTTKQKIVSKKAKPIIKQKQIQPKSGLVQKSNEATTNEGVNDDSNEATTNEGANDNSNEVATDEDANEGSVKCDIITEGAEKTNQPNEIKQKKRRRKRIESTDFTCETCNLSFSDRKSFTMHKRIQEKSKCDICGRLIKPDNMKNHVLIHTASIGPSVCSVCGVTYKNFNCLRAHFFHYHKHTANQYICEECGKSFRMKYTFLLHKKKVHMGIKNCKCSTCGKAFFANSKLLSHIRMTHEKLRPHVCEYCGTGFFSRYALRTHERQHTDEKPFVCQHCSEGFRQRVSLRSHLKSKHGIEEAKDFLCKTCEKGFATDYALSVHQRSHETKKCEICSENFAGDEYLANHLREIHHLEVEMNQDS
ncbi:zinc finger protein 221-like isoform X6 [Diabrotica virgifera virgifera]|uniref:Uncharacterized protein n=1 Tax=Diabrotica virgifera virgifera TaxID=50390 RepID=A0ABM5K971_DIAVI|nr:zinc finger protein 221-like isoform X6 [Diabrotica virgifera virgifera]